MKKTIKKVLDSFGLLNIARSIKQNYRKPQKQKPLHKYRNVDNWKLKFAGLDLHFDTSDWYSKGWFYPRYDNGKLHEPLATQVFIDRLESNSQVLDIGGHLGYFSCIAGYLAKEGRVDVFEVDPKCIGLIENNLKINNLKNVTIHNHGVSDAKEIIKIPQYDNPNPSLIINSEAAKSYLEVESVVIDDFLAQQNIIPDFIKIDVEGAEGKVLNGMKNTIKTNVTLLVEVHVEILRNHFNTDYKDIVKLLLDNGFVIREIEHRNAAGKSEFVDLNTTLKGNTMILCTKGQ